MLAKKPNRAKSLDANKKTARLLSSEDGPFEKADVNKMRGY